MGTSENADHGGLQEFYERTYLKLLYTAMGILHKREDAEEIVGDVYLTLLEKEERYRGMKEEELLALGIVMVRNACINRIRERERHEETPIELHDDSLEGEGDLLEEVLKEVLGELVQEEIQSFPSDEELERLVQPSGEFMARMERAFEEKERKKKRRRVWRRVSAAVASVAAVFGLVLVLNEDVRAFCLPFLRQQDEVMKMTDYRTEKEEEGKKEGEHGKIVGFELTYIPEGFVYSEEMSGSITEDYGLKVYENKDGMILDFDYASFLYNTKCKGA